MCVFGPGRDAAEIEWSKSFAKDIMQRHNIPTARYRSFTELDEALTHISHVPYPIVIKAAGLAAGKGVILPDSYEDACDTLYQLMVSHVFGDAGEEVVIEERLQGEEVSVLAFSDGTTVKA